eukprot:312273-Hanusia_phi.AAC.2
MGQDEEISIFEQGQIDLFQCFCVTSKKFEGWGRQSREQSLQEPSPGTRNAIVLPEPVGASTTTSLLESRSGMTIFCTGAMYSKWRDLSDSNVELDKDGLTEVK